MCKSSHISANILIVIIYFPQNGYTPLIAAARCGNVGVIEALLGFNPTIDKGDNVKAMMNSP